jgi:Asp-tRNA(Asn)/Glu-tRNA(Gln) amidotransferase A subunit family amidase
MVGRVSVNSAPISKATTLDLAAEEKRQEALHHARTLFERYDVLVTPAAPVKPFPVEMNFPDEIATRAGRAENGGIGMAAARAPWWTSSSLALCTRAGRYGER